jgi:hypothetical protein
MDILKLSIFLGFAVTFSSGEVTEKFYQGHRFFHRTASEVEGVGNVTIKWFTQALDHFTPSDTRTWKQVLLLIIIINDELLGIYDRGLFSIAFGSLLRC